MTPDVAADIERTWVEISQLLVSRGLLRSLLGWSTLGVGNRGGKRGCSLAQADGLSNQQVLASIPAPVIEY